MGLSSAHWAKAHQFWIGNCSNSRLSGNQKPPHLRWLFLVTSKIKTHFRNTYTVITDGMGTSLLAAVRAIRPFCTGAPRVEPRPEVTCSITRGFYLSEINGFYLFVNFRRFQQQADSPAPGIWPQWLREIRHRQPLPTIDSEGAAVYLL